MASCVLLHLLQSLEHQDSSDLKAPVQGSHADSPSAGRGN